jgi:hypothetical protein
MADFLRWEVPRFVRVLRQPAQSHRFMTNASASTEEQRVPPTAPASLATIVDEGARSHAAAMIQRHWTDFSGLEARVHAFVERVNQASPEGKTLLFIAVHRGNFPTIEYIAHGIGERGWRTFGLYLLTAPPRNVFEDAIGCDGSLALVAEVLRRVPNVAVYLQAHARWAFLSQWIGTVRPGTRIYQEVYDWMDAFITSESEPHFVEHGIFTANEIRLMRASEEYIRTRTAGFVFKGGGPPIAALLTDATVPHARITPSPPRSWMLPPRRPSKPLWSLVHAGQLRSQSAPKCLYGDLHYLPVIRALTAQGMDVSLYPSFTKNERDLREKFADYLEESERNPRCHVMGRLPLRKLIAEVNGQHHFGLLLYRFDESLRVGRDHFACTVASKLFTYVAAGLPILVSAEFEFMASLVKRHQIGLVVDPCEVDSLAARLAEIDYEALLDRVASAQDALCIERSIPDVLALLSAEESG